MRFLLCCAFAFALTACSKKKPPEAAPTAPEAPRPTAPEDTTATDRAKLLAALKGTNNNARLAAVEELAVWVDSDPESVAALLELLKDKTNAGSGRTHPIYITSTREAAARALALAGPRGEAALQDKGLAALRDGLTDPSAAVREHTAHTLSALGRLAKPLSTDVMKLCTDADANVRGTAFDALRVIGITDAVGFTKLLNDNNREVVRLAAEIAPSLKDIPDEAIPQLNDALSNEVDSVRTAAAAALVKVGPRAAKAAPALVEAIKASKAFERKYDPNKPFDPGPEGPFWKALAAIGEPAVAPTVPLLTHPNALIRAFAAETLGEIGPRAKPAVEKLRAALNDEFGFVAIEAACALMAIGESKDEAYALVKRAIEAPNNVAQLAIEAVVRIGDAGKPLLPDALKQLGNKENAYARYAAIGVVATLPPAEATKHAAEVGKLALDAEPQIAGRAGRVLERLGPAAAPAAEVLGQALGTVKDNAVRDQLIDALVAMGAGAKPAVNGLLPFLGDQAPAPQRVRVITAVTLADPSSAAVATAVLKAAGDGDIEVRSAAALALAKLNPVRPEALTKLAAMAKSDSSTKARFAALMGLALAGKQAAPVKADVEALATGKYPEFAFRAKIALAAISGNLGGTRPEVVAALADKNTQVREAATDTLLLIGPTASDVPALMKLCRDTNSGTRLSAAQALGHLGSNAKEAVPQLVRLLDAKESEVRAAAAEALGEMGAAAQPAVAKLKELRGTKQSSDPIAGPAARKALERLGVSEKK